MKRSVLVLTALILTAGSVMAGEANFKPARMSGEAPAAETKRARVEAARSDEPGFWKKEWKRSGLSRLAWWRKNQDDAK